LSGTNIGGLAFQCILALVGGCPGFKIIYFAYIFAMDTASM